MTNKNNPTMAEQIASKDAKETLEAREALQSHLASAQAALSLETAGEQEDGPTQEQQNETAEKKRDEWEEGILSIDKELIRRVVLCTGGPHIEIRAHYIQGDALTGDRKAPTYTELTRAEIVYIGWFDSPHEEIQISDTKYPDLWAWLETLGENEG